MDECLTGTKESVDLTFSIFNFLGEYANKLTREPSITERTILNDTVLNPDQTLTPEEIKQRQEVYDIQNGAMRSIVLRLLKGSMYQTPQIRICCVEALAKIAFRSLDPIRLFVYECLSYLASVENFGVSAQCSNVLRVLDELYVLQQAFLKLTTRVCSISYVYFVVEPNTTRNSQILCHARANQGKDWILLRICTKFFTIGHQNKGHSKAGVHIETTNGATTISFLLK